MGLVQAEITLKNAADSVNCERGLIDEQDVRSVTVTAIVDTGAMSLVIPGAEKVLLGSIPLEDMDLMVNPVTQELIGAHGDSIECMIL